MTRKFKTAPPVQKKGEFGMRAALYARFSTDLQYPRCADDQLDACRTFVERQGGAIVMELKDEATSGASIQNRPGVLAQGVHRAAKSDVKLVHLTIG
jgi:hypothetical protein